MEITFSILAEAELEFWQKNKPKILLRVDSLVQSMMKTPFLGIGKPEKLKHNLKGFWSRRIDQENRLVYKVESEIIVIVSCKGHYTK